MKGSKHLIACIYQLKVDWERPIMITPVETLSVLYGGSVSSDKRTN